MAEAFKFELVSPERLLVSEQVESVVIPGAEGEMTVMAPSCAGHDHDQAGRRHG